MMKKLILTLAAITLSACGFTPMHAPQLGDDGRAFENIKIQMLGSEDIANSEGAFWVEQALYDRLGKNGEKHILTVKPVFARLGLGISAQDVATRYDMAILMDYKLKDAKTGKELTRGRIRSTSTFGAPRDPYGRAASEKSATKTIAKEATDRLLVRLAAYYANAEK